MVFAYEGREMTIFDDGHFLLFGKRGEVNRRITTGQWNQYCGTWSTASMTFKAYINGTLAGALVTSFGRRLKTGGTLVLGDYLSQGTDRGWNHQFDGEMYNFTMFAKELSGREIEELFFIGICAPVPEKLQPYRIIKWKKVMKLPRQGNVTEIRETCWVSVIILKSQSK